MEDSKLRRNVLEAGTVSSLGSPTSIVSIMSGQEEMFAFRRAVSGVSVFIVKTIREKINYNLSTFLIVHVLAWPAFINVIIVHSAS